MVSGRENDYLNVIQCGFVQSLASFGCSLVLTDSFHYFFHFKRKKSKYQVHYVFQYSIKIFEKGASDQQQQIIF